ncbi:MAG: Xaa-Pro peptidase family protein, partial [Candidatus Aminicenantes bacterium]|nr:Xaa-Pro peptidase family protein [Candidatus Aminicenantes bacterium]
MMNSRLWRIATGFVAGLVIMTGSVPAERSGFSKEEFFRRRTALMDQVKDGLVIFFGDVSAAPGAHFRQDNDFFYFSGNEDTNAVLLMVPRRAEAYLFLPQQTAREEMVDGPNLLRDPQAKTKTGFTDVFPLSYFDEFLARTMGRVEPVFHLRLSPRDTMDGARYETSLFYARQARTHYNDQVPIDNHRLAKLRERYPQFALKDVTPLVDVLRAVKSPAEVEVLRRNGRISAEAVKQAMLATKPGVFEYEIEAAAMHVVLRNGARGAAYAPIVGSGPNSCIWHYDRNDRRVAAGDLVLMDFGADLDHMAMDITRTWPVGGRFSPEQREVYEVVLAVEKACIEAYRPGATAKDVQDHVARVLKEKGLDPRGLRGGFGHGVGLSTH